MAETTPSLGDLAEQHQHHVYESIVEKAVPRAVRKAGLSKPGTCHSYYAEIVQGAEAPQERMNSLPNPALAATTCAVLSGSETQRRFIWKPYKQKFGA